MRLEPCKGLATRPPPSSLTSKEALTMSSLHTFPLSFARREFLPTWWPGYVLSSPIVSVALSFKAPQIFSLLFLWEPPRVLLSLLCCLLFIFLPYICLSQRGLCFP